MKYLQISNLNLINANYKLLQLNDLIENNNFIIFFNYNKLSNLMLLNLKNELFKENVRCLIVNAKYIKRLFVVNFFFLSSFIIMICVNNLKQFLNTIKILSNIKFFYSFKNCFSNIINNNILLEQYKFIKFYYIYIHYIIFRLILNIIIIILYLLISLIKLISYKNN